MVLSRDTGVAARGLMRRPGFALLSALTLSASVGLATTIFCVADAVLLRPLPFRDPTDLVAIWNSDPVSTTAFEEISYPVMALWRDQGHQTKAIAGMESANSGMQLTGSGEPVRVPVRLVSGNFFSVLGTAPALGRAFSDEEDRPGGPRAVVLSFSLWKGQFGADPGIVGRSVVLDDHSFTVIGIMPAGFRYPEGTEAWVSVGPVLPRVVGDPGVNWMVAIGRLKAGATRAVAAGELTLLFRFLYQRTPDASWALGHSVVVTPLSDTILGSSRPALAALLGAVGLVFLIACANVAGLSLIRTIERGGELAVREALGASRQDLLRLVLLESVLLSVLGGVGGLVVARVSMPLVVRLSPQDVPRLHDADVNARGALFAAGLSGLSALLSGLAPMLLVGRLKVEETLRRAGGRIVSGRRAWRAALVVSEVAIALVLLVDAGLFARSFVKLSQVPLGFEPQGVFSMPVELPQSRYPDLARLRGFDEALLRRVRALPEVSSAAVVLLRPLSGTVGDDFPFVIEGQSPEEAEHNPLANLEAVSVDYFRTMGISLKRGRDFDPSDTEGKPGVVVVSEGLARRYWPEKDPIGQHLRMPMREGPYHQAWLTVVGVVADARYRELEGTRLDIYMSYLQAPERVEHLVVRGGAGMARLVAGVRAVLREMDRKLPLGEVVLMPDIVSAALGSPRFATRLFVTFAVVAILFAALGLYTLLAYSVRQRTREIGVRMALGADRKDVHRLLLREGAGPVALGLAIGLCGSLVVGRLVASLLYGVSATEPAIFGGAPLLLGLVGLLTSVLPARRAARLNPVAALRSE